MSFPRARRSDPADERLYQPRLRLSGGLGEVPDDAGSVERANSALAWRTLQAPADELMRDRVELDRLDRAIVATRKQLHAARNENTMVRNEAKRLAGETYSGPAFWTVGAIAVVAVTGWIMDRRKVVALQEAAERESERARKAVRQEPAFQPTAEMQGNSDFERSDLSVMGDEADQWIAQSGVAMPAPR
jgi:hypothetical protein